MAKMTPAAYTGTTPPTGVTTEQWSALIDGQTMQGIRSYPTAAQLNAFILYIRGGLTGSNVQLHDAEIGWMEQFGTYGVAAQEDPSNGYVSMAPAIRGCDAAIWTGGVASPGTDEIGGADLMDLAQTWALGHELGMTGTPRVHGQKAAIVAYSAGTIRAARLMMDYSIRPQAVILRSPYCNIYDWDNVDAGTKTELEAMIPNWTSEPGASFAALKGADKDALWHRSPAQWGEKMPNLPYLIIHAENDTKVPVGWSKQLANRLAQASDRVDLRIVPSATHAFSSNDDALISLQTSRKFMAKYLA